MQGGMVEAEVAFAMRCLQGPCSRHLKVLAPTTLAIAVGSLVPEWILQKSTSSQVFRIHGVSRRLAEGVCRFTGTPAGHAVRQLALPSEPSPWFFNIHRQSLQL